MSESLVLNIDGEKKDISNISDIGFSDKGGPEIDYIPMNGLGWNEEVINTLTQWVHEMTEQYTIYSILQNGLIETSEFYSIWSLVCSGVLAFINVLKYILETEGDAEKAFSIAIGVISFMTLLSTGMTKIKNVPARIQTNAAYMADVHRFVESINIEKQKPEDHRRDAKQFVMAMGEFRGQISNSLPDITYKERKACIKIKQATKKELAMTRTGSVPIALSSKR